MPEASVSGDLFSLSGDGRLEGAVPVDWLSTEWLLLHGYLEGAFGVRVSVEAEAELCHGLDARLSAEAAAEIEGAVGGGFLVAGLGAAVHGEASAGLGVKANVQLEPDLFDRFGLTANLAAYVRASVAGRAAITGNISLLAQNAARILPPGLPLDILLDFIQELRVEGGVWGRAHFAAMAEARLEINGSFSDDEDAGFQVRAGFNAAAGGGTGWDAFFAVRVQDPRRFYLRATERITDELVRGARRQLPADLQPAAQYLELVLPTCLAAAYDIGQMVAVEVTTPNGSGEAARPFNAAFGRQVLLYVLDKVAEVGLKLLDRVIDDAIAELSRGRLSDADRTNLKAIVDELINLLGDGRITIDQVGRVAALFLDAAQIVAPEHVHRHRRPIAILWSAAAAGQAIRDPAVGGRISIGLVGLGSAPASGAFLAVPPPPAVVKDEYESFFGRAMPAVTYPDTLNYLLGIGVIPHLEEMSPEVMGVLSDLGQQFNVTPGELVTGLLQGIIGSDIPQNILYEKVRTFAKNAIDAHITGELIPELHSRGLANADARIYLDEVAHPCLLATSDFVFNQIDQLVLGLSNDQLSPFLRTFRSGLSALAGKIITRNVVAVSDILLNHVMDNMRDALLDMERAARSSPNHAMTIASVGVIRAVLQVEAPDDVLYDATRILTADLCGIGAKMAGPDIWSDARRTELRRLMYRAMGDLDEDVRYQRAGDFEKFATDLAKCFYVPNPDAMGQLLGLLGDVSQRELAILAVHLPPVLEVFFLRLSLTVLEAGEREALALIDVAEREARAALEEYERLRAEVDRWIAEAEAAAREFAAFLEEAAGVLKSASRRSEILNQLLVMGMDEAERITRSVPGFNLLPADQQANAVAAARSTFDFAFGFVRPVINEGLRILGDIADDLGDVVRGAANVPDLLDAIADEIIKQVKSEVRKELRKVGLDLPNEITVGDVADVARDIVIGLFSFRHALEEAFLALERENEARAKALNQTPARDAARSDWDRATARESEIKGDAQVRADILSPLPMDPSTDKNWVYPRTFPIYVRIKGARMSYVQGRNRRVTLSLNGRAIIPPVGSWTYDAGARELVLRHSLTPAGAAYLRVGLNVFECSVANGAGGRDRKTVAFLADPRREPRPGKIAVAGDLSQFDAPSNDHRNATEEFVAIKNVGDETVQMKGWRIYDRKRHEFVFGRVDMTPGRVIEIHTGQGRSTSKKRFWGRNAAVWNNRGDAVYVVDPDGVLRAEHVY